MKSKLVEKIFSLQAHETKPVLLLLVYSFFMGAAIALFYTSTTSLILSRFDSSILPYAYISGGIIVYFLSELNRLIQARYKLSTVLLINISFLLVSTTIFILINFLTGNNWMIFLLFVWVRVFTFIHGVSFWAIAVKIFDIRQGKRLFGLISSGEVLAAIFSQFSIPLLLNVIKTEDLLYIGIVEISISLFFIAFLRTNLKNKLDESSQQESNTEINESDEIKSQKKSGNQFKIFFENKYNSYLFLLALLPMFGMYYTDFIFFTQSKEIFSDKEVLTQFIGIFLGFSAILELSVKSLLTGKLVSKYGLKIGLLALPSMLLLGFGLPSVIGTVAGQGILFFSFISAGRLFMRIIRVGVNDPVFQILFQPIDKNIRTKFQNQVEGQPKALGNILAGIILIILNSLSFINILHITYFYVAVILVWLRISLNMYREYRRKVREELKIEKSYSDFKNNKIDKNSKDTSLYDIKLTKDYQWLDKLLKIEPYFYESMFYQKLSTSDKIQKIEILKFIIREKLPLIDIISKLSDEENDEDMKHYYKKTLKFLQAQAEISLNELERMANSNDFRTVLECSRWVGYSKRYRSYLILEKLFENTDERIVKSSLLSAGISGRKELKSKLIEYLFQSKFALCSYEGLKLFSRIHQKNDTADLNNDKKINPDTIVRTYSSAGSSPGSVETETKKLIKADYNFSSKDIETLTKRWTGKKEIKKIVRTLGVMGGKYSIKWLRDKINFADFEIRYLVIDELIKLGYKCSSTEMSIVQDLIEKEMRFIIWLLSCKRDIENYILRNKSNVYENKELFIYLQYLVHSIHIDLIEKKNSIFNLLCLIYNPMIIKVAKDRIEEGGNESKAFGLEMLEMTLNEGIKELLINLFDLGLTNEALENYRFLFPESELTLSERLEDIIMKDFNEVSRWTKVCAIECIENIKEDGFKFQNLIAGLIFSKDRIISETSLLCLNKINNQFYEDITKKTLSDSRWDVSFKVNFRKLVTDINLIQKGKAKKMTDLVRKMGEIKLFSEIPELLRIYLVDNSEIIKLKQGDQLLLLNHLVGNNLYFIIDGEIIVSNNKITDDDNKDKSLRQKYTLKDNDIIFSSKYFQSFETGSKFIAMTNTEILKIDYDYISEFNIFWQKDNFFEKIALKLLQKNSQMLNEINFFDND